MASLRNLAVSLLRTCGTTNIAAALRHNARKRPTSPHTARSLTSMNTS
jgi:hypothetical protein